MKVNVIIDKIKEYKKIITLVAFAVVVLAVILVATLAMKEFVVPVCILLIVETAIAALLRKSELWLHGVTIIVQLLTGLCIGRFPLMALCVVIYVAATVALMIINKENK
jgi:hypothetical protein